MRFFIQEIFSFARKDYSAFERSATVTKDYYTPSLAHGTQTNIQYD
jgi:hypothetical protein